MIIFNVPLLSGILFFLVILSAFFSSSETGMMSLNRYRLRHLVRKGDKKAKRIAKLLERPDRLLGVILLGNTFANIMASSVATVIAVHYFGDVGVLVTTIALTVVILIFAEAAPKTYAALHPLRMAYLASFMLKLLLQIFYPIIFVINAIANSFLRLFGIHIRRHGIDPLSAEELRTVVHEATGKISSNYQQMLLRILDLEQATVEDVMIPRGEITGINLEDSWEDILKQLMVCDHQYVPLYRDSIDKVCGMLNLRKILVSLQQQTFSKETMISLADKVYFIPEGALTSKQLLNFQNEQRTVGLVVDEYGDIQGLVSLQDILEEIVGEFSCDVEDISRLVKKQRDGSFLVSGNIPVRELNRIASWDLPTDGPKTLSGLIIEYLETIPTEGVAARVEGYPMEVVQVSGNRIRQVRVWPELKNISEKNET